jgi:hypothetical protein
MSQKSKRTREHKQLRESAEGLWHDQQVLLQKANVVAKEARRQAGNYTREQVAPRMRDGYEQYVRPRMEDARSFARYAGGRLERTVVPAVGTAIGTALSVVDVAKDARGKTARRRNKTRPARRRGRVVALGVVAITLTGLAYAVWQTFRADDELWVSDETVTPADPSSPAVPEDTDKN